MTSPRFGDTESKDRTVSLVRGYHRHSYPPPEAYDAGLRRRFAVVLDTYRHGNPCMFFDVELFLQLCEAVFGTIRQTSTVLEMHGGGCFTSLEQLGAYYDETPEEDREPPVSVRLSDGGRLVCIEETEFWTQAGGPPPYHDSYTLSFYLSDDRSADLYSACVSVCADLDAEISGYHQARPDKKPYCPVWCRWLRWLGIEPRSHWYGYGCRWVR